MDRTAVQRLLEAVQRGEVAVAEAARRVASVLPGADVHAEEAAWRLDHHRGLRCGFAEVVFAPGKAPADLVAIAAEVLARAGRLLVTRCDAAQTEALLAAVPGAVHHARARAVSARRGEDGPGRRGVAILAAGTADVPVAEEARVTAETMGEAPRTCYDVGVAGLHRLLAQREALREARVLVVCAGMEGALPSVVGGLVDVPVIAVPTSVGYGMSLGGVTALLAMLNACAPNVTVVNVDNGFGAGYVASLINRTAGPASDGDGLAGR